MKTYKPIKIFGVYFIDGTHDLMLTMSLPDRSLLMQRVNLKKVRDWSKERLLRAYEKDSFWKLTTDLARIARYELRGIRVDWEFSSVVELIDLLKAYAIAKEL